MKDPTQTTAERFRELWYSFDCEDHYAPDTNIVPQIIEFIASETAQAKREEREETLKEVRRLVSELPFIRDMNVANYRNEMSRAINALSTEDTLPPNPTEEKK